MTWTSEREDLLRKLWRQGLSARQIAYVIAGVTRNAVIGKAHRMGLPKRSATMTHRPKQRPVRGRPSLACIGGAPAAALAEDAGPATGAGGEGVSARIERELARASFEAGRSGASEQDWGKLMTLTGGACKWPIGDPVDADFRFCNCPAEGSRSYCAFHLRLAYRGRRRRSGVAAAAQAGAEISAIAG
ncbi:GcrA cell cycle regulator [Stappia taiwanensis]|uniref:GcrA cell cycle regulator n=1 Tax=Stappia taiwanensis TaxID=992267 RepID=A0A838XPG7_9HYPH|nr:GcrA family cell cycle regulator [Stappia taiwanensis]MBA4612112.1 GcrA cell cycle regulator [Stappia taiwanensis]GGE91013.1 GcrA cell cycle regulator [Stappia taiwanensis]